MFAKKADRHKTMGNGKDYFLQHNGLEKLPYFGLD